MSTTKGPYYLGRVKWAPAREEGYRFASVEPLVESDAAGTQWLGAVRDATTCFPKRGLVHWHDAPVGLQKGSLWQFTIDDHPLGKRGDRQEEFQLQEPHEPVEVLDLRGWSDEVGLRSAITSDGIPLTEEPLARRVLLWLATGVCVGPWLLKPGVVAGHWAIDAPEPHRDAGRMPILRLSAGEIKQVPIDGGRWFVSPPLEFGPSGGVQNWTSDAQVARSVLPRLRKMDPDLAKAVGVTDALFRQYLDRVESGRMGTTDPAVERARADRVRGLHQAIQSDAAFLGEAAESLLGIEAVRAEVNRLVQTKVSDELQSRRAEIEAALATANDQRRSVEETLVGRRAEVAALEGALLEKQRELDAKVASFDAEMTVRLEKIARRPEAVFVESAILRGMLAPALREAIGAGKGTAHTHPSAQHAPSHMAKFGDGGLQLDDDVAVRQALVAHASANELSLYAMLGLHAAFVAGPAPLLMGSRGYDLLRAYAAAVAGGRLHWIPIGSSALEPHDLLGRFDSTSGRLVAGPSGLLDVVTDGVESGRLHVVVFEGFNRAPSEAYLSPILEAAEAGRLGDAVRAIPLANPDLLSAQDPYRGVARLAWPPSVLIACLATDGSVMLPVPASVWRFLALIDADDRDRGPVPATPRSGTTADPTEIRPSLWKDSVVPGASRVTQDGGEAARLASAVALLRRDAHDAIRVRNVLCANGLPSDEATAIAVTCTLIARSGLEAKAIEEGLRSIGVSAAGWRTVWAEAQRLRS